MALLPAQPDTALLRVGLALIRSEDGPAPKARPVRLDQDQGSDAWLGGLVDRTGIVRQWIEIRVQRPAAEPALGEDSSGEGTGEANWATSRNDLRDAAWRRQFARLSRIDPAGVIATGWEERQPVPAWIDPVAGTLRTASPAAASKDPGGSPFELCVDDALLESRGLPPYSSTTARFLMARDATGTAATVALDSMDVTAESPLVSEACAAVRGWIPWNAHAGLMMVRRLAPLTLDVMADLLDERGWRGFPPSVGELPTFAGIRALADRLTGAEETAGLFLLRSGRQGRRLECLHLKLTLLLDAWSLVQRWTQVAEEPLLNLEPESFRVHVGAIARGLPALWSARVELARPGVARRCTPPGLDRELIVPEDPSAASPYWPPSGPSPQPRSCTFRPSRVLTGPGGLRSVSGQVLSREGFFGLQPTDLFGLRVLVGDETIELIGRITPGARGVVEFESYPRRLADSAAERLEQQRSAAIPRAAYWRIPVGSSHHDIHALGRIAVRVLFGLDTPIEDSLRHLDLLRGHVEDRGAAFTPASIAEVLADERELESLLTLGPTADEESTRPAPRERAITDPLRDAILAFLLESTDDARASETQASLDGADPRLFAPGIARLRRLVAASRGLIQRDEAAIAEIRDVIELVRAELAP